MITKETKKGGIRGLIIGFILTLVVTYITFTANPLANAEVKLKIIGIIQFEMIIFGIIAFILFVLSLSKGLERIRKKQISDYLSGVIRGSTVAFGALQFTFTYLLGEYSNQIIAFLETPNK